MHLKGKVGDTTLLDPNNKCQNYPKFFRNAVENYSPRCIATAFSINFPTWGKLCGKLISAVLKHSSFFSKEDLAFFAHFAGEIPGLSALVKSVHEADPTEVDIEKIRATVLSLHQGEQDFWNGVYDSVSE